MRIGIPYPIRFTGLLCFGASLLSITHLGYDVPNAMLDKYFGVLVLSIYVGQRKNATNAVKKSNSHEFLLIAQT